jgi:DNA-binding NarL/FixJ family response regulator
MKLTNIAIVDDHTLFAEGISNLFANSLEYNFVFISSNAEDCIEKLNVANIDILIIDINLPNMSGLALLTYVKKNHSSIKVLLLSMYQPFDVGIEINTFKGDAYVLKVSGKAILNNALHNLANGNKYFDPNIINTSTINDNFTTDLKLTRREKHIIKLIAEGKTSKEIADQLFLSELTIKTHRKNINDKLGVKSVVELLQKTKSLL